jgi:TolB-like protein
MLAMFRFDSYPHTPYLADSNPIPMPTHYSRIFDFWKELKRRKVLRVITVYAAVAFVILQLVEILAPSLRLPEWTMNLILVLLIVGFIIAVILSWIYDVHPEGGIVKTEPARKAKTDEIPVSTNSWRIATYVSVIIIVVLIALNIFGSRNGVKIDESLTKSIAVLPFHNLSGDAEQEWICKGLTDEIISHLYKINSFDEVRSFTSVSNYSDPERNIPRIAEELRVNYILEGSYKRMGDEMKITAQLIEPRSDNHIWLKDYKLPYSEVPGIPGEIALQIAEHLNAFLSDSERKLISKVGTSNPDAFAFLKQAQGLGSDMTTYILNDRAIEAALKAIELDPDYASAYATMGWITIARANYGGGSEMLTAGFEAEQYLKQALELDPDNPMAHGLMGLLEDWFKWDYIAAEREYLKAMELMPHDRLAQTGYGGLFLTKMKRTAESLEYIKALQSYTDDPWHFIYQFDEIRCLIVQGSIHEAQDAIERLLDDWKEQAFIWVGDAYTWLGEYDSALHYLELGTGDPEIAIPRFQACLALAFQKTGRASEAQAVVQGLIDWSNTTSAMSPAFYLGWYYSGTGELDSAFYWMEKAYRNRSPEMPWLKADPIIANLKEDDRYWDLYERTGHKAYDEYMAGKNK